LEADVRDRFLRAVLLVLLALVIVVVARPYIDEALFAAKAPRPVEARGDLAQIEQIAARLGVDGVVVVRAVPNSPA
jgi:hypothetical protein